MIHPGSTQYIDIHAHNKVSQAGFFCLPSIFIQDMELGAAMNEPFTAGLHPWHLRLVDVEEQLKSLELIAGNDMLRAIGECGLDRNVSVNFDLQRKVFIAQMKIANHHRKPLMIHAVKSYSDFLNILKSFPPKSPWIFHGFNGNSVIAKKLLSHENIYLSFGASLLHSNSYTAKVLEKVPHDRIFLETDEATVEISSIYTRAAEILQLDGIELKKQIFKNYREVFDV